MLQHHPALPARSVQALAFVASLRPARRTAIEFGSKQATNPPQPLTSGYQSETKPAVRTFRTGPCLAYMKATGACGTTDEFVLLCGTRSRAPAVPGCGSLINFFPEECFHSLGRGSVGDFTMPVVLQRRLRHWECPDVPCFASVKSATSFNM